MLRFLALARRVPPALQYVIGGVLALLALFLVLMPWV